MQFVCFLLIFHYLVSGLQNTRASKSPNHHESVSKIEFEYYSRCKELLPNCTFHSVAFETLSYSSLNSMLQPLLTSYQQLEDGETVFIGLHLKERPSDDHETNKYLAESSALELVYVNLFDQDPESHWIILSVIPTSLRKVLDNYISFYFPSNEVCGSRPLSVEIDKWSTWGNRYGITAMHHGHHPESIFGIFIGDHCAHHNGNRFARSIHCNKTNKFECLFLPSTNCTFPNLLTDCSVSHSLGDGDSFYFTNATAEAAVVHSIADFRTTSLPANHPELHPRGLRVSPHQAYSLGEEVQLISPETVLNSTSNDFQFRSFPDVVYMSGIHFRQALFFRDKVQQIIQHTRLSPHYGVLRPEEQCVVLHLRKADRILKGFDGRMREWCHNHTNYQVKTKDQAVTGEYKGSPLHYGQWMNFGCLYTLPYGDASLEHYFNASLTMFPDIQNLFVMTDDPGWLDENVEKVLGIKNISAARSSSASSEAMTDSSQTASPADPRYSKLRIFPLASKRVPELARFDQYEANAEFWASIEIAKQCQGLILHPGSAVARVIAYSMCFKSSGVKYLHCPDFFDMSAKNIKLIG
jgi:hypothetical protein